MKFNRALTFGVGLMLAGSISVNAQKVTFNGEQVSLKQAFQKIESVSNYKIAYNATQLDVNKTVTLNQKNVDVLKVLDAILADTGCTYTVNNGYIVITPVKKGTVKKIEGIVKDTTGEPVIGATVMVKGTTTGTITDFDGKFSLDVEEGSNLEVSYVGYQSKNFKATAGTPMSITLKEDTEMLEEVVVVGYGVQKKVNLSGAVSAVKASEVIKNRPVTAVASALQGALPGLQITNSNNTPGSQFSFNVRGFTSINGGSPLILVDNNPIESISMLNPDDIESVSVLKDAASSSIYGARAAYGVVLITTKKAKENEKIKVSYSNNFSFSTPYDLPEKASTKEYITMLKDMGLVNHYSGSNIDTWLNFINEYNANPSLYPTGTAYDENGAEYSLRSYDMVADMMDKFGFQQQHNASVQGASGKNAFRVSLGYTKEDGVLYTDKDSYRRTNFSAYWKTEATKWLSLEADIKFANTSQTFVNEETMRNGLYGFAIKSASFQYTYAREPIDGIQYLPETAKSCLLLSSPIINDNKSLRLLGKFILKPFKGMVINGEYSFMNNMKYIEDYRNKYYMQEQNGNLRLNMQDPSSYSITSNPETMETINLYGNYSFNINNHEITLMGGFNQERRTFKKLETKKNGVISDDLPSISQSTGDLTAKDNVSEYATRSLFYRINYGYKGKYLFETNGRYDGSSRFPSDSRFGFFPSASAAWRFSEENFLIKAKDWMSNGKLRFSIGTIGNQNIGNYEYLPTMSSFLSSWIVDGKQVVSLNTPSLVSPNFTWETVVTYNLGLDFTFWNKLNLSFDTYIRNTKDMLVRGMELPAVLGATPPKENVADLRTKGWELDVKWFDKIGNVDYHLGFNLSDSRAMITNFYNEVGLLATNNKGLSRTYRNGQYVGEIWGYQTEGLYQAEHFNEDGSLKDGIPSVEGYIPNIGDILYKDFNEDGIINKGKDTESDPGDMIIIGNTTPRYHYSINGGLSWKNFTFSFIINGIGKQDLWTENELIFPYYTSFSGIMSDQLDYWTSGNNNAYFPRMYENCDGNTNANRMVQTRFLVDASYCQIKNLMLQYKLPKKIINKIGVGALSFYVSGENLYTFKHTPKGLNPYGGDTFGYPNMRKISFGLNLTL